MPETSDNTELDPYNVSFVGNRFSLLVTVDAVDATQAEQVAKEELREEYGDMLGRFLDATRWVEVERL